MADNISITAGTVATDQVGSEHYQKVKLVDGTADSSLGIPGDATYGLDVDVTRVTGTVSVSDASALTSLQVIDDIVATEDAVAGSGFKGVPMLVVRQDAHSDLAADGDFLSPTIDADGGLRVSIVAGAGSGGTAMTDDAAFTPGTTSVTPVAGIYRSALDTVNDGDAGALAMTPSRALYTAVMTPNGDSAMNDTTNAVNVHIVGDEVGSAVADEDGSVATGATNVAQVINAPYEYDGSAWVRVRGPQTVAHDAADAGNPPKLGAKAESALSGITLVADGDRTDLYAGLDGVLITRPHCNLEDIVSGNASNTDGTNTQVIAAAGAGIKVYLTTIILTNTHATTDGYVEIKDGTTVKMTIPVPHASGAVVPLTVPIGGTANTAWNFDPSAAISTLTCSMVGFKSKI
jgi:hypothetical protein